MATIPELFRSLWSRRPARLRRRQLTFSAAAVDLTAHEYAAAIYSGVVDLILSAVKKTDWRLKRGPVGEWGALSVFLRHSADVAVGLMINEGRVPLVKEGELWRFANDGEQADYVLLSSDMRLRGVSTYSLLLPALDYLNNIVNAANTSISRLGVLAVFSPKSDEYGNTLTAEELKEEESRLQDDYGVLKSQHLIKFFAHSYDLQTINMAGENLQLSDRFTQAVKIICGKLKVPFELVPCATLGNVNQTGVYQGEAVKRLYQTVAEWQSYFVDFAAALGLEVEAVNIDAPQDYDTERAAAAAQNLATISGAISAGLMTPDEGRAAWDGLGYFKG